MTRFVAWFQHRFIRSSRLLAISIVGLLFLGACYQEVPVSSTPVPEVIEAPVGAPTQAPVKEPEKKPEDAAKTGDAGTGGGGGGAAATPVVQASPNLSCFSAGFITPNPTTTAFPTCTPISGIKLPGSPVVMTPGAVKTPISGTKPVVTPPATVKSGTIPTVKPGTTPATGVKTAVVPTVKAGSTAMVPTVKPGATITATVDGSPASSISPTMTPTGSTTSVSTVGVPSSATATSTGTVTATVEPTVSTESGVVYITKRENFANAIVPGACFSLVSGDIVATAICDQQAGDVSGEPGVIGIEAPAGSYMVRETTPPEGYEPGADIQVVIVAGTPVAIDVINHLIKTTDTLTIAKVDQTGAPLSGSCFDIAASDGAITTVCDDGVNDLDPSTAGSIRIEVNSGDYILRETPPAGYSPTEVDVSVVRGSGATIQVVNAMITPSVEPTVGAGVVVANIVGADGTTPLAGICLTLTGAVTYSACDNGDGDVDPTEGTIEIDAVIAGDYSLTAQLPEGIVEAAPLPSVTVTDAGIAQLLLPFTTTAIEPTVTTEVTTTAEPTVTSEVTPTTEPTVSPVGVLLVQSMLEDGTTPLGGVCLTLTGPITLNVCDNGEGDPDPTEGAIELDSVPVGEYSVTLTTPEGYESASELQLLVIADGQVTQLALIFRSTQPVADVGIVVVQSLLDDGVTFLPGLCFTLTGTEQIATCDNGEGDADPTEGVIERDAVPAGDYTVEVTPPQGYELASEQPGSIRVEAATPASIALAFRALPVNGALQINKVDAVDGVTALGGSCFDVSGPAGTIAICDDDANDRDELVASDAAPGVILLADLPPGDYTVHESQPPTGYDLAPDQSVVVSAGGTSTVTFADSATVVAVVGSLTVTLTDQAGNPLPGACLSLVPQFGDGAVPNVDLCDGGEGEGEANGQILFAGLQPGSYLVTEASPPVGYLIAEPVNAEIPAEGGDVQLAIAHLAATGSLAITTLDPTGAAGPNACYRLTAPDSPQTDWCDDDGDGSIQIDGLAPGDYTVTVVSLPEQFTPGEVSEQIATVTVEQPAALTFSLAAAAPATVALQVLVTDEGGQPLPGACVEIQGPQNARACDDIENDADPNPGSLQIAGLLPGEYIVTQSQAAPERAVAGSQTIVLDVANPVTQISLVNISQPTGVALGIPVVYADDAGRLWVLRPNDPQPTRLDTNERPWDQRTSPVASYDHVEIAFMITNPDQPAANMIWLNLGDLSQGSVDFGGIGTPMQIAFAPGRNDLLIVGVQLPTGLSNVYFFNILNQELTGPVFAAEQEPSTIDAIIASPTSTLVALQTTGADGDPDTWLFDANTGAELNLTNVGPNDGIEADYFAGWSPVGDALLVRSGAGASVFSVTNFARAIVPVDPNPIYLGDSNAGTAPAWSADGSLIMYFDNDPAAGGQLRINRVDGTALCEPITNVQSAVWSPNQLQLWTLMTPPDSPQLLMIINADCSMQQLTSFDVAVSRLRWAPGGGALALVSSIDGNAALSIFASDAIQPIDMAKANVAFADILSWSPGGEVLALYASGPSVSLWIVVPGSDSPVAVAGSTVPEGANYVTRVWWP